MSLDVYLTVTKPTEVFQWNITHNLNTMARQAGIYEALWRPEEICIYSARQLIVPLSRARDALRDDPEHFRKFNPVNGGGTYEGLVEFVEKYLEACIKNPDAEVRACR
jgi:hypothetical protein